MTSRRTLPPGGRAIPTPTAGRLAVGRLVHVRDIAIDDNSSNIFWPVKRAGGGGLPTTRPRVIRRKPRSTADRQQCPSSCPALQLKHLRAAGRPIASPAERPLFPDVDR